MEYERDEAKRRSNLAKHGVDFSSVREFEWDSVQETEDTRNDYGERRWVALGRMRGRLHVLIYTRRRERVRVISLRIASKKEVSSYEAAARATDG